VTRRRGKDQISCKKETLKNFEGFHQSPDLATTNDSGFHQIPDLATTNDSGSHQSPDLATTNDSD